MHWLKAKALLIAIALVWGSYIFLSLRGWWQILITLLAIPFKKLRRYRYNLWISQDQDVNATLNGNPDITMSSRVGYLSFYGSKTARAMEIVIDWIFYVAIGQKNHCRASIEHDEEHY